jgi:hypothetical protein
MTTNVRKVRYFGYLDIAGELLLKGNSMIEKVINRRIKVDLRGCGCSELSTGSLK